jgi:hypothetical protein
MRHTVAPLLGLLIALGLGLPTLASAASQSSVSSGSVSIRIVGLPTDQAVDAVLRGPDGLERSVSTATLTISKARPGVPANAAPGHDQPRPRTNREGRNRPAGAKDHEHPRPRRAPLASGGDLCVHHQPRGQDA